MDVVSLLTSPILVLQVVVVVKAVLVEVINREGDSVVVIPKQNMVEATEAADR